MNCKQCGAPMKVEDGKSFFHCSYCDSYDFPDPNQDRVALLGELSSYKCPICDEPLVTAVIGSVRIFSCPVCRGNLISQSKMLPILNQAALFDSLGEGQYDPPGRSELDRKAICPACQELMDAYQYGGPGNIIIEGCSHCEMIWLDFGEISRVLRSYSRTYKGPPDKPGQRIQSVKF